jgi:flavin-dependent dehydrogenase
MTPYDAEVIVVGAGPAGSTTAALLAGAGRDVLVLDKATFPREKACAEFLSPGVEDVLARVGSLARVERVAPARPPGIEIRRGDDRHLVLYENRRALGVRRSVFDAALLEHAVAEGARLLHARATRALVEDGRVTGVEVRHEGVERRLRASLVVGADGLHSVVARSLALDLPPRWPHRLGLVARYGVGTPLGAAEMHVGARAYCGLTPVDGGLVTASLVVGLGAKPSGMASSRFFDLGLSRLTGVGGALDGAVRIGPVRGLGPLARRVRRTAGRGFVLVGDAAGFLDPFTGEGVYRAVAGAELAAAAIDRALRTPERHALDYERMRAAAFRDKERLCLLIQAVLASGPVFGGALRRLGRCPATAHLLSGMLGDYEHVPTRVVASHALTLLRA